MTRYCTKKYPELILAEVFLFFEKKCQIRDKFSLEKYRSELWFFEKQQKNFGAKLTRSGTKKKLLRRQEGVKVFSKGVEVECPRKVFTDSLKIVQYFTRYQKTNIHQQCLNYKAFFRCLRKWFESWVAHQATNSSNLA